MTWPVAPGNRCSPSWKRRSRIRPILILSVSAFNTSGAELVIVLPLTSKDKRLPYHVTVSPPEGGLSVRRFIKCEDARSISLLRLHERRGTVAPLTLSMVEERVRRLLGL